LDASPARHCIRPRNIQQPCSGMHRVCSACFAIRLASHVPCPRHPTSDSVNPGDQFLYSELKRKRSIRVLRISQASDGELEISLRARQLTDPEPFTALSYTWGDPSKTRPVICEGRRLDVTINLYTALQQFRADRRTDDLWIDAICINQASQEEKAAQVRMMGQLYGRADLVLTWLGESTTGDEEAFDLLNILHERVPFPPPPGPLYRRGYVNCQSAAELGIPGIDDKRWQRLGKLCRNPYWYRGWIIQETVLARRLIVQWGHLTTTGDKIFAFGCWWMKYQAVQMGANCSVFAVDDSTTSTTSQALDFECLKP